jgi:hypothetical protein
MSNWEIVEQYKKKPERGVMVTKVWLRNDAEDGSAPQVLLEVDGHWYEVISTRDIQCHRSLSVGLYRENFTDQTRWRK